MADASTLTETTGAPAMDPYGRLAALGIELPPPPPPIANFLTHVQCGSMLFLSGQGPRKVDGSLHTGKVGGAVSIEAAYDHARLTGVNLIAVMHAATGDLRRVRRVVKLLGFVNCGGDFNEHPKVVNGCSDLFVEVFGERGAHARSAIGVASLPNDISVELEAVIEVCD
ncbi:MAG TPA: RidA family protein [Methylomirabilota bacterium]|nr:RidA family protein [Methylomirabilota bacterium]